MSALSHTGVYFESQLLLSLSDFGYMVNLFNLLPIGNLDGGRVASVLSKYFLLGGFVLGGFLIYGGVVTSPLFYLLMILGGFSTASRFFGSNNPDYLKNVPKGVKGRVFGAYLATIGVLLFGMNVNHHYLIPMSELRKRREKERRERGGGGGEIGGESEWEREVFRWSEGESEWEREEREREREYNDRWRSY